MERTNEEWLTSLRPPPQAEALSDLRRRLVTGLGHVLASKDNVREADIEDFVQDALLKILEALETFRGESRFTTWAQKIAVRTALTELRRRRWRNWSLDEMVESMQAGEGGGAPDLMVDPSAGPEVQTVRDTLVAVVRRTIAEKLTERQRIALVAIQVHGAPLEEVARRLDTNRNALYKLMHDARQRLRRELLAEGLSPEEILAAFETPDG